eukprot:TRINITY_DN7556_c0_g1_i1.p1 TRINITY_DN7556_c0_g1~~TRINITY_DN7556_c0_g1_i1.p1  ORF type:complete len:274 (-),score=-24.20 TRINITY_DN7556_c0_g1_i1:311-1132(-)
MRTTINHKKNTKSQPLKQPVYQPNLLHKILTLLLHSKLIINTINFLSIKFKLRLVTSKLSHNKGKQIKKKKNIVLQIYQVQQYQISLQQNSDQQNRSNQYHGIAIRTKQYRSNTLIDYYPPGVLIRYNTLFLTNQNNTKTIDTTNHITKKFPFIGLVLQITKQTTTNAQNFRLVMSHNQRIELHTQHNFSQTLWLNSLLLYVWPRDPCHSIRIDLIIIIYQVSQCQMPEDPKLTQTSSYLTNFICISLCQLSTYLSTYLLQITQLPCQCLPQF